MENWRAVPGTNGEYEISISTKEGKCRSLKWCGRKGVVGIKKNTISKNYGRIYWNLYINGKNVYQQAARWIAITYPELVQNEYFDGAQIDHIDTNTLNNHPSNLRWVTARENVNNPLTRKHASDAHKGIYPTESAKEKMRNASPKKKQIAKTTLDGEVIAVYRSIREAARQTGLSSGNICLCCKGVYKTIDGFKWIYYS